MTACLIARMAEFDGRVDVTTGSVKGAAQLFVTEIVTHVTPHDAIGRNMALLRPCTFENATNLVEKVSDATT